MGQIVGLESSAYPRHGINWRMAEESNPHGFPVITVFKTACRPRSETIHMAEEGGIEPHTREGTPD